MNNISLFQISIKDYFTKPMLSMILYPLLGSLVVLYFAFFSIAELGLEKLENTQIQIEQHQTKIENGEVVQTEQIESYTGNSIVDFLLKYTITSWIVSFLVYTIGLFAIGYMSIFLSLLIVGLLTPRILAIIHRKHYPTLKIDGYGTIIGGIWKLLYSTLVMFLLFIILIPFYFIPIINIFAINLPFYYFFHKMLHYDVGSTLMQKDQFNKIYYFNKTQMRLKTLFLYSVSLIPFVAFFIAVFYIIYLGHTYFIELDKEQNKTLVEV
ncbi:MAG: EI24 domain-containing protein [Campylobacterota bacterium]|nr:EI24 domain-containing protein [Campylobacterota bacterium]